MSVERSMSRCDFAAVDRERLSVAELQPGLSAGVDDHAAEYTIRGRRRPGAGRVA